MDKLKFETPDMVAGNVEKIGALFPAAITEMRGEDGQIKKGINFEVLKQLLSRDVVDGDECYEFTWVGKKAAMAEAARPITKTLRPVKEDSRDWDTTQNLYIEGDNLEVLKILQESYLGKVKMIYIDPPYNTGHDFIYRDKFQHSQQEENEQMGMYDEDENQMFENTESNGRFHSDWCSMIYMRLLLARNLLCDKGFLFISIDENEFQNLKKICLEIFGYSSFLGTFIWRKKNGGGQAKDAFVIEHEYILVITKGDSSQWKDKTEYRSISEYTKEDARGRFKTTKLAKWGNTARREDRPSMYYPIKAPDGSNVFPIAPDGGDGRWRVGAPRMQQLESEELIYWESKNSQWIPYEKEYYSNQEKVIKERSILYSLANTGDGSNILTEIFGKKDTFENPKPVELINLFLECASDRNDIVLDFFSGSATTAHAVMQLNAEDGGHRKFIMVQLPEPCDEKSEAFKAGYKNICEIGKERIRRAGDKIQQARLENISTIQHEWDQTTYYVEHQEECDKLGKLPDEYYEKKFPAIDTGFRVFRVDSSNMKDVYYQPDELDQQSMFDLVSNIKDDRTDMDLLYACLLDWGVEIHLPHTSTDLDGCTVHNVDNGALMACFSPNVPRSVVEYMAKQQPLRAVFRDSAFASDDAKINVTEIFKNLSPDTKVKVI